MNCLIIDDQLQAQNILKRYIAEHNQLQLVGVHTSTEHLAKALETDEIDLIFLDIHLPKVSGVEFLKTHKVRQKVIMTTAFSQYAAEGFDLNVTDYLVKPFSFERFSKAIDKALSKDVLKRKETIYVKSGHDHIRLKIKEVLYITSDMDYTEIHLEDGSKILSNETLANWERTLERYDFLRVHKSYIVNLHQVKVIKSRVIYFDQGAEIPIGRAFKDLLQKKLKGNV